MPTDPKASTTGDPLENVLDEVEAKLKQRLRDACDAEAEGVENASSAEIRQLEDALLSAAVAAEQTIALRTHIDRRKTEREKAASEEAAPTSESTEPVIRLREFRDATGQLWRAWPVTPGQARQGRNAGRYLGEFHKGWICFESLDSPARRRLPQRPMDWAGLTDSELIRLLDEAITAPVRKLGSKTDRDANPST
jgi:hypothetical protein